MRLVAVAALLFAIACRPPGWGKGDDEPAVDAARTDAAPDTAADASAVTCDRMFRLEGHATATSVWLTGDFIAWGGNPTAGALPLTLGADMVWTATRTFDPGNYQYKFIVDSSSWIADPANPNFIDDGFGGRNSVYACTP